MKLTFLFNIILTSSLAMGALRSGNNGKLPDDLAPDDRAKGINGAFKVTGKVNGEKTYDNPKDCSKCAGTKACAGNGGFCKSGGLEGNGRYYCDGGIDHGETCVGPKACSKCAGTKECAGNGGFCKSGGLEGVGYYYCDGGIDHEETCVGPKACSKCTGTKACAGNGGFCKSGGLEGNGRYYCDGGIDHGDTCVGEGPPGEAADYLYAPSEYQYQADVDIYGLIYNRIDVRFRKGNKKVASFGADIWGFSGGGLKGVAHCESAIDVEWYAKNKLTMKVTVAGAAKGAGYVSVFLHDDVGTRVVCFVPSGGVALHSGTHGQGAFYKPS